MLVDTIKCKLILTSWEHCRTGKKDKPFIIIRNSKSQELEYYFVTLNNINIGDD